MFTVCRVETIALNVATCCLVTTAKKKKDSRSHIIKKINEERITMQKLLNVYNVPQLSSSHLHTQTHTHTINSFHIKFRLLLSSYTPFFFIFFFFFFYILLHTYEFRLDLALGYYFTKWIKKKKGIHTGFGSIMISRPLFHVEEIKY